MKSFLINYLNGLPGWLNKLIGVAIMLSLIIAAFWTITLMVTVIGWPFMFIIDKITG